MQFTSIYSYNIKCLLSLPLCTLAKVQHFVVIAQTFMQYSKLAINYFFISYKYGLIKNIRIIENDIALRYC